MLALERMGLGKRLLPALLLRLSVLLMSYSGLSGRPLLRANGWQAAAGCVAARRGAHCAPLRVNGINSQCGAWLAPAIVPADAAMLVLGSALLALHSLNWLLVRWFRP